MHCTKCRCSKNRSKPAYGPNLTKARFVLWRVDVIHGHKAWTCYNCNNQKIAAMQNIWYTKHAMVKGIHIFLPQSQQSPTIANHQNPTSHNLQTKMRQISPPLRRAAVLEVIKSSVGSIKHNITAWIKSPALSFLKHQATFYRNIRHGLGVTSPNCTIYYVHVIKEIKINMLFGTIFHSITHPDVFGAIKMSNLLPNLIGFECQHVFFCILHPKSSKRKIIVAPMSWTTHEGGSGRLQKRVVVYDESGGCPGRLKALDNPFRPINDQDPTGLYSLIQQQPPKNPKKSLGNFSSLNSGTCGWLPFKS